MLQIRVLSFIIAFHRTSPKNTSSSQAGESTGIHRCCLAYTWEVARAKEMQETLHPSTKPLAHLCPSGPILHSFQGSNAHADTQKQHYGDLVLVNPLVSFHEFLSSLSNQFGAMFAYREYFLDVLEYTACSRSTLSSWAATDGISDA